MLFAKFQIALCTLGSFCRTLNLCSIAPYSYSFLVRLVANTHLTQNVIVLCPWVSA